MENVSPSQTSKRMIWMLPTTKLKFIENEMIDGVNTFRMLRTSSNPATKEICATEAMARF